MATGNKHEPYIISNTSKRDIKEINILTTMQERSIIKMPGIGSVIHEIGFEMP